VSPPFPNVQKPPWYREVEWKNAGSRRNGVHYVGDDVVIDISAFPQKLTADFEGGTNVSDITTGGAEASSSPWSAITVGIGNSLTYSNSQSAHGGLAAHVVNGGNSSGPSMVWTVGQTRDYYNRSYMYFAANPNSSAQLMSGELVSDTCWAIILSSSGILQVVDASFTPRATFSTAIALNQWVRLELHMDHVGGGIEIKLFNSAESATATETQSTTGLLRGGADTFTFGGAFLNDSMYWDDIIANATSYPGPYTTSDQDPNPSSTLAYQVRDYFGNVVSAGTMSELDASLAPTVPGGGWKPGWYRVYLTGDNTDDNFADSYGVTNFCVIKNDSRFVAMPAGDTADQDNNDFVMKGVMGLGTSRHNVNSTTDYASDLARIVADVEVSADYWTDNGIPDTARPAREQWCAFNDRCYDVLFLPGTGGQFNYLDVFCKDETIDGSQVFLTLSAGSSSGRKVQVSFPDAVTIVETYDNLASPAAAAAAMASSDYVKVWESYNATAGTTMAATAIGHGRWDAVADIVSTLYPLGVTRFEGPENEPPADDMTAHKLRLFQGAVHEGNANAKALGPCAVAIPPGFTWTGFFDANGGSYVDEISFHAYNFDTNGDINLARSTLATFQSQLATHGLDSKVLWQTESTQPFNCDYGVYHPRRARRPLLATLLLEEAGVPRERNNWWYDVSHGFWSFPSFIEYADGSLGPEAVLVRRARRQHLHRRCVCGWRWVVDCDADGDVVHDRRVARADHHWHCRADHGRGRVRQRNPDAAQQRTHHHPNDRPSRLRAASQRRHRIRVPRERMEPSRDGRVAFVGRDRHSDRRRRLSRARRRRISDVVRQRHGNRAWRR
jgi:hypothetical protein